MDLCFDAVTDQIDVRIRLKIFFRIFNLCKQEKLFIGNV